MIVLIKEWIDDHECQTFLLDTTKLSSNQPFEHGYLQAIQKALASNDKSAVIRSDVAPMNQRFGLYQDSLDCWERLKAKLPCQVDAEIEIRFL